MENLTGKKVKLRNDVALDGLPRELLKDGKSYTVLEHNPSHKSDFSGTTDVVRLKEYPMLLLYTSWFVVC